MRPRPSGQQPVSARLRAGPARVRPGLLGAARRLGAGCLAGLLPLLPLPLLLPPSAAAAPARRPPATAPDPATDTLRLLAAVTERDTATLDALAESGPPATRALASVAQVHTLDDIPARRAAQDAGFLWRWDILEPIPGGPRGLDRSSAPLDDWIDGRAAGTYAGVLGPTTWRAAGPDARYGLLDLAALTADVPGHRLARAAVRITDGGAVVAWVYSATPWRLWVDGQPAGGGWGEPSLRAAEPVLLNIGPGAHRLLLVTHGDEAAVAVRLALPDGRPISAEPLAGRNGPHGISLGPLPGKPMVLADPLAAYAPDSLPPELAPRAGLAEATPDERRLRVKHAPDRAPLWRRIAAESDGAAAREAWGRVTALDPLDLEARRRAEAHAWPAPERDPEGARVEPPAGFDGPLWWALAEHRIEAGAGGALLEQHLAAVHIREADTPLPWPPADAEAAACTRLRGPWVQPLRCADGALAEHRPGDVVVITWRRGRRGAATVVTPPPAPFGRWSVRVEAAPEAPLRIEVPAGTLVEREGERRLWQVEASTSGGGTVAVGTLVDDAPLGRALDARVPPARPMRVPDPRQGDAIVEAALRASSRVDDPRAAARYLVERLAAAGEVADPVFARPAGFTPGALPDPDGWPAPLVAIGERVVDPRHPEGARGAALQGVPAVRIGPDGGAQRLTLPVDPPSVHGLTIDGELRIDDGALFAVTIERTGRGPLLAPQITADTDILESTADRVTARRPQPGALFRLPGFATGERPGPHRVSITLLVRAPAGLRAAPDLDLDDPRGRYTRRTTPTAEGWRTVRTFEWRSAEPADGAFLDAVRAAELTPLVLGGAR